jgi:hypothetical protein
VKKPVSKFGFQVRNLQRYTPAKQINCVFKKGHLVFGVKGQPPLVDADFYNEVGRCTLESS